MYYELVRCLLLLVILRTSSEIRALNHHSVIAVAHMPKQLVIPEEAIDDLQSLEMMRVWIANKRLHTSLNIGVYHGKPGPGEEKAWGVILADAIRHLANAMADEYGSDRLATGEAIRSALLTELGEPTSAATGSFVRKH